MLDCTHAAVASISGGGVINPTFAKGGTVFLTVTGGGVIVIESEAPTVEEAEIVIEQDPGGAGPRGRHPMSLNSTH